MISGAFASIFDFIRFERAKPVELLSVSFGPSTGPDWSVRVIVREVVRPDEGRCQNSEPSFWSAGVRR